jgi:RES domain-containing protein
MTVCAYRVDCDDVLDLRDPATLAAHSIAHGDLSCLWEDLADRGEPVPSWELADRLQAVGVAAIIVPSFARGAAPEDANVVLWRWSRQPPHFLQVIDDHGRLPSSDASWRNPTASPKRRIASLTSGVGQGGIVKLLG